MSYESYPPPAEPAPPTPPTGGYPISLTFDTPDHVARWRPIVHWLLIIPQYIVLYVLQLVNSIVVFISWLCGVFAGKIPEGLLQFTAMVLRYQARVFTYIYWLRGEYPPFTFDAVFGDPGGDRVKLDAYANTGKRSRLTIFFRLLLIIPLAIEGFFLVIALYIVLFIGWFAVIILGRWPEGLGNFVVGYLRWSARVSSYFYLLTDEYPPFGLD